MYGWTSPLIKLWLTTKKQIYLDMKKEAILPNRRGPVLVFPTFFNTINTLNLNVMMKNSIFPFCPSNDNDNGDCDNNKDVLQSDVKNCGLASKLPSDCRVVILLQNCALIMMVIMSTMVKKMNPVLTSELRFCFK